jgi:hypothetical protein
MLIALVSCLVGCQVKKDEKSYTYELSENGCSTGSKTFASIEDLCASLRNDSANNNCASSLRYERFKSDCPGQTW